MQRDRLNTKPDIGAFGWNIKRIIDDRRISVAQLAERMSISPQAVHKWIRGTSVPTPGHLLELSRILQVEVDELFRPRSL